MRIRRLWLAGLALLFLAAGCSRRPSGIQVTGSDTLVNLAQAWAAEFMKAHPQAAVSVTGGGSGVGIAALLSGTTDIATASREMEPQELAQARQAGLAPVRHEVALDAVTVVVNPRNPVARLTIPQLAAIYTGRITNWQAVGGPRQRIVALARDRNSGTHLFFLEHVLRGGHPQGKEEYVASVLLLPSNQAIADEVAGNPWAIGYVGLGYLEPRRHRAVAVAASPSGPFVLPSAQTVRNRSYPIARPLLMYTRQQPRPQVSRFLAFVTGRQGQAIVPRLGFVPVR